MRCHICGSEMIKKETDLPFKISNNGIVILKNLPAFQCSGCSEYVLEDSVVDRIERIFAKVNEESELEILKFAA